MVQSLTKSMSTTRMFLLFLVVAVLELSSPQNLTAQNPGFGHPELYSFDTYLDGHNNVAAALVSVPGLITDSHFLAQHPDLVTYFGQHPDVQTELSQRPDALRNREARFRSMGVLTGAVTRTSADWFDQYLVANPNVYKELRVDPKTIDSPAVLAAQTELAKFLGATPGFADAFKLHPAAFLARPDFFANAPGSRKTN